MKTGSEIWDSRWESESLKEALSDVGRQKNSVRWRKIKEVIYNRFGDFQDLDVIELGSGKGTHALLFAEKGASVTILDYSKKALKIGKRIFDEKGFEGKFLNANVLKDLAELEKSFDVSMSFGLLEHFEGKDRLKAFKSHIDVLRDSGITLISVPNKLCAPYRIQTYFLRKIGKWDIGMEIPFTRNELVEMARRFNLKNIHRSVHN